MERDRVNINKDSDSIITEEKFAANEINLVNIDKISDHLFRFIFYIEQHSTGDIIFLGLYIHASNYADEIYFNQYMHKFRERRELKEEVTEAFSDDSLHYLCDFDMINSNTNKLYFEMDAYRLVENKYFSRMNILLNKDLYIKISLFFNKMMQYKEYPEDIFLSKKFNNVEFVTINHLKHDGSGTDNSSNIVLSHYTCGRGPTIFKFNYVSPKKYNKKLRNPIRAELYSLYYEEDFSISDMIYNVQLDILYVIYEIRDRITQEYKSTKVLCFTKEFYERTNFIDLDKIYEKGDN